MSIHIALVKIKRTMYFLLKLNICQSIAFGFLAEGYCYLLLHCDYIWLIFVFHVKHPCLRCHIIGRLFVACPPSSDSLLVGLLHFGLRPVQQDRLRICPLQCRQRQQNISLVCEHKAGLSFAKIPT